jgi:hypothetical protein
MRLGNEIPLPSAFPFELNVSHLDLEDRRKLIAKV